MLTNIFNHPSDDGLQITIREFPFYSLKTKLKFGDFKPRKAGQCDTCQGYKQTQDAVLSEIHGTVA